jgi:photosystem II stability/assembly factor-like uncharacterized protein
MQEVSAMRWSLRRAVPLLPLILLIAAAPALAAPVWKALGPFGGTIQTLTVAPSNARVIYAMSEYEGAFRSTDGGASWVPIHGAFITGNVAIHPNHPGTIYLSNPAGKLVKSTDFGSHWTLVDRGLGDTGVTAVAVDPARPSRLYAGVGLRVFRSTNGGASWQPSRQSFPASYDPKITALLAVPRPAGTVFALTGGLLFKSGDAGMTWRTLAGGLPNDVVTVAVSPAEPWMLYASVRQAAGGGIFRSRDAGASWEAAHPTASPVISLAVSPRSARTVWAGTEDRGLLVSYDGGAHWKAAGPRGISKVTAVAVPLSSPRTVFAASVSQGRDAGGVFASEDGGATWERRNRGLAGLAASMVVADPATRGVLWASLEGQGLFRSVDGGRAWTLLPLLAASLAMAPSAPSTLYAMGPTRMWRSDDGGASWNEVVVSGELAGPSDTLWVDPVSATTLWSNGNGLVRSVDGGATWVRQPIPNPGAVRYLAFAPSSPSTMYAVGFRVASGKYTRVTAWRSTDGGATWTSIDQGLGGGEPTDLAVDPVDSRLVYVTACGYYCSSIPGLWKSTDGGAAWTLTGKDLGNHVATAIAASPIAGVVWTAVENGRLFRSADGGGTWQERAGPQARVIYDLIIDPHAPRRVYAATSSGVWVLENEP